MSIFTRFVERKVLAYVLSNYENGSEERFLSQSFKRSFSGLHKVPYDDAKEITVGATLEEEVFSFARNRFLEFFGLGTRVYVMDQFPGLTFGKPVATLVFRNFSRAPLFILETESEITVNGEVFRFFDNSFLNKTSINPFQQAQKPGRDLPEEESPDTDFVFDEAFLETVDEEGFGTDEPIIFQNKGPLMRDFPPDNVPNPLKPVFPYTPIDEEGPAYVRPPRKATYLFYGLCFEESRKPTRGKKGYHPVSKFAGYVMDLKDEFGSRGYRARTGVAGRKAPDKGEANNFAQMMKGLKADIAKNTAYCKNAQDQLVIYINGHGYSPAYTKTGNIAMHYDTELMTVINKKPEYVSFSAIFKALEDIKEIKSDPKKVYLILDTCRSFRSLSGCIPASLSGMHLILSDDHFEKSYAGEMAEAIRDYLMSGGKSWKGLVKAGKYLPLNKLQGEKEKIDIGLSYNTNVKGCAVSIKLETVEYQGQDVGSAFSFGVKVNSSASFMFNGKKTRATNKIGLKSFDAKALKPSGSFKWGSLAYEETLWPACAKGNKPDISYEIDTKVNGLANAVKVEGKFNVSCETAKTTPQVVKVEVSKGQNKATLQLSFSIIVRCVK